MAEIKKRKIEYSIDKKGRKVERYEGDTLWTVCKEQG